MKICFVAVNAKYVHTSPAVRILDKIVKQKYESTFMEFTIKDNIDHIVKTVMDYDIIGLSCYIWNIEIMRSISKRVKTLDPTKIVFAGGPEVSYDTKSFVNNFDYVMAGEGEEVILPFIDAIVNKSEMPEGIADTFHPYAIPQYVKNLENVPDILDTYTEDDKKNRIVYVETTRGCPFNCSYCLSSVEKGVRYFSDEHVEKVLDFILNNDFKSVKFLDRTFNVKPSRFLKICKILEKTKNTYQFEIAAELLNDEVINYFLNEVTPGKFNLEVGIQSLMSKAVESVSRKQNGERLIKLIDDINKAGRITIHADLIAGLPYETLDIFKDTFNRTFALLCDELQLGFLKMLRGTKLRNEADEYNYRFTTLAPYEVISNDFITEDEMDIVHECENALDWMWNHKRCVTLIKHLVKDQKIDNYFDFFVGMNKYYDKTLQLHENYGRVLDYLKDINLLNQDYIDDLKYDYLNKQRIKPKPFWPLLDTLENYRGLLGYDTEDTKNYFVTPYYDKYIVIKYEKGKKPKFVIENK